MKPVADTEGREAICMPHKAENGPFRCFISLPLNSLGEKCS